jgi:LacI family transcriptional regulator
MVHRKNVKMKDIAEAIGVSTVTVSKALANKEGVSDELRSIIKNKATELGYVYNPIPKSMLNGRVNNVGILVSKKFLVRGYDVYFQIYETIVEKLTEDGYFGLLEVLTKQEELDCEMPRVLRESKVDGIILLGQISYPYIQMIASSEIPFVLLDFYGSYEGVTSVVADNFYGSYILTSYLIKKGHRKIGFVGNYRATSSIMDRYMGYLKSLIENDCDEKINEFLIMDRDNNNINTNLTLPKEMPTAFVCNNDEVANTLIGQLIQNGYNVPEDVSVVGFDNFEKNYSSPIGITTVEVDFIDMGKTAVDIILKKIQDSDYDPGRHLINCRMVIRDSVKAIT